MKIEELKALEARATKGPWTTHAIKSRHRDRATRYISTKDRGVAVVHGLDEYKELPPDPEADANQELIAALREALVGVIKEADRETDAFIFARKVLARSETAP